MEGGGKGREEGGGLSMIIDERGWHSLKLATIIDGTVWKSTKLPTIIDERGDYWLNLLVTLLSVFDR